jgi:L-gulono-1,4-lactone dehydrogenase
MNAKAEHVHSLLRELEEIGARLPAEATAPNEERAKRAARELEAWLERDPGCLAAALEDFVPAVPTPSKEVAAAGAPRQTWRSYLSFQNVQPLQICKPGTLAELVELLRNAGQGDCAVPLKAVGSGHSFSDVATTPGYLVETHQLHRILPLDTGVLKDPSAPRIEVEAGVRVKALNQELDRRGLALENMGAFDGQTIAGAISTGTHGTGVGLGPMASLVESLTLVTTGGKVYRIEPTDGITDPGRYRHPFIELKQNDDWFYSTVIGVGCLGVIYSLILRVRSAYRLAQVRTLTTWDKLAPQLRDGSMIHPHRHFDVLINPYPTGGRHTCLITTKDIVPEDSREAENDGADADVPCDYLSVLATRVGLQLVRAIMTYCPQLTPRVIDFALHYLHRFDGRRTATSHRLLAPGGLPIDGYAAEIGFLLDRHVEAADMVIRLAGCAARQGRQYQTSPFSLRYVKASPAYLAPQHGRDTCMLEVPVVAGTVGGVEMMHRFERGARALGGRPHWGLEFELLNGSRDAVRSLYPMYDKWVSVFRELNKEWGAFHNSFTSRLGFE